MKVLLVLMVNLFFILHVKSEEDIIAKAKKILEDGKHVSFILRIC